MPYFLSFFFGLFLIRFLTRRLESLSESRVGLGCFCCMMESWKSMREVTRERLLVDVLRGLNQGATAGYRVLVLDERATHVLNACLRMFDVTQEGIALVESLEKERQPFPDLEAVYIMDSAEASVRSLVKDFTGEAGPLYKRAHVFLLRTIADADLSLIKEEKALVARIAGLTEIHLNYMATSGNVFHFDRPAGLVELYNADKMRNLDCLDSIVQNLATVCATLNEYPFVRFDERSEIAKLLAGSFQEEFNNFIDKNSAFWWRGDGQVGHGDMSQRATLIILDRTVDPSTPLMHSFTYEALLHDLLNTEDDLCRYYTGDLQNYSGQDEARELLYEPVPEKGSDVEACLLNDDDPIWVEYRHLHIKDVIENLNQDLQTITETSVGQLNREDRSQFGATSLELLTKAVQELPEYQELIARHKIHVQLVKLCMHKVMMKKLLDVTLLEQTMATGVDESAKEAKMSTLATDLMKLVRDPQVGVEETARLIGLFMICQEGIKEEDRRHILESADPPLPVEMQTTLLNLSYLNVNIQPKSSKSRDPNRKTRIAAAKEIAASTNDPRARYTPEVAQLVDKAARVQLPKDLFPYVIEPPAMYESEATSLPPASLTTQGLGARSGFPSDWFSGFGKSSKTRDGEGDADGAAASSAASSSSHAGGGLSVRSRLKGGASSIIKNNNEGPSLRKPVKTKRNLDAGAKVILFIAGGVTHAEIAAIDRVIEATNRDIIVGSTHIMSPKVFLHNLKFLEPNSVMAYDQEQAKFKEQRKIAVQERIRKDVGRPEEENKGSTGSENGEELREVEKSNQKPRKKGLLFSCGCLRGPP